MKFDATRIVYYVVASGSLTLLAVTLALTTAGLYGLLQLILQ